jgi:hypothetical protein
MSHAITGLRGGVPGQSCLDDPLEELAHGPHPLPVRLRGDRLAAAPGLGGQPYLVVLDVIAADVTDRGQADLGHLWGARSLPGL